MLSPMSSDHPDPRVRLLWEIAHNDDFGLAVNPCQRDVRELFPGATYPDLLSLLREAGALTPDDAHVRAGLNALGITGSWDEGRPDWPTVFATLGERRDRYLPFADISLRTLVNYESQGYEKLVRNYEILVQARRGSDLEQRVETLEALVRHLLHKTGSEGNKLTVNTLFGPTEIESSLVQDFLRSPRGHLPI
tara:strand:- start:5625 stop:6203 length:579 start_codon:yes stop_codon:yes gene_type:complete